jgi:hypothetical protein
MLRNGTLQRAFLLWGKLNREYKASRDPIRRAALKLRKDELKHLILQGSEQSPALYLTSVEESSIKIEN